MTLNGPIYGGRVDNAYGVIRAPLRLKPSSEVLGLEVVSGC